MSRLGNCLPGTLNQYIDAPFGFGQPRPEKIVALLKDDSQIVRRDVLEVLRWIASENPDIGRAVIPLLDDPVKEIRYAVPFVLARIGAPRELVVDTLFSKTADPEIEMRTSSISALTVLTNERAKVVEHLFTIVLDPSGDPQGTVRITALESMARLSSGNAEVGRKLLRLLDDADEVMRRSLPRILSWIGEPRDEILNTLIERLERSAGKELVALISSLRGFKMEHRRLVPILTDYLHAPEQPVRVAAYASLKPMHELSDAESRQQITAPIIKLFENSDADIRYWAVDVLSQTRPVTDEIAYFLARAGADNTKRIKDLANHRLRHIKQQRLYPPEE